VDALDVILLGRELAKIGERAFRGGSAAQEMPSGRALVLRDVFANPDSPVSAITARTGLPQSYVSESIAALCEEHVLVTSPDPHDRRRTLASVSSSHRRRVAVRASTPVDDALEDMLGKQRATRVLRLLLNLSELLGSERHGPTIESIRMKNQSETEAPG
jgi:DNA-binding MarR family transcriptional regulator